MLPRRRCSTGLIVLLGCTLCPTPTVHAGTGQGPPNRRLPVADYIPGELLVLTAPDAHATPEETTRPVGIEKTIPGQITRRTTLSAGRQVLRVKLPAGKTVKAAIAEKWGNTDARILAVEPNYRVHILGAPNDPRYPEMWSLSNTGQTGGTPDADIDAPEAWDTTTGSGNVIVAVLDTGVDYLHPDLAANMWHNPGESGGGKETNGIDDDNNGYVDDVYGYDFLMHDADPSDPNGHGTHVAGTIGARGNNALGISGISRECRIMACRFLDKSGSGTTADAIEAINYAVANGARVLNNSWGDTNHSAALQAAIENARDHGVLFVTAAGDAASNNDTTGIYPANENVSNVVAVAATDAADALAYFSNFGGTTVHLGAPGDGILSTVPQFTPLFFEDFQGANSPAFVGTQMSTEGPVSRWGTAASSLGVPGNIAARADYANSSPYLGGSDGSLVTPPLDTRGLRGLTVSSLIRIDAGAGDSLSIDVWDANTWTQLTSISASGLYGDFYYLIEAEVPENRRAANSRFRWRWVTDGSDNNHLGVELDLIGITYIGGDYSNSYALFSGTSMAAAHVSGVAALILAADPGLTLDALKYRILNSGDSLPSLQGRTITGRRLNANGAVHPLPPTAFNAAAQTSPTVPVTVMLSAIDDGRPGPLQFVITSLPTNGTLSDPVSGAIGAVPFVLSGNTVTYTSLPSVENLDTFQFVGDDGGTAPTGGPSPPATVGVLVTSCLLRDDFFDTTLSTANWPSAAPGVTIDGLALSPPSPPNALRLDGTPAGAEFVTSRVMDITSLHGAELRYAFEKRTTSGQPVAGEDLIAEYLDASNSWVELSHQFGAGPAMTTFQSVLLYLPEPAFHPGFQFRIRNISGPGVNVWHVDDVCIREAPDQPPIAASSNANTFTNALVTITLLAFDANRDVMSTIVSSLPAHGALSDPQAGAISSVPYTLAGDGHAVLYTPDPEFAGSDSFQFKANDGHAPPLGGDSNVATVSIEVLDCRPGNAINPSPSDGTAGASHNPILTWAIESIAALSMSAESAPVAAGMDFAINSSAGQMAAEGPLDPAKLAVAKTKLDQSSTEPSLLAPAAPLPDFCSNPQAILGASPIMVTAAGTNAATVSPTDPIMGCGPGQNSNTLWYQIIPANSGNMHISTCGSNYDTVVAVWEGGCSNLARLDCNDDSCGLQSNLTVPVQANTAYLIEVADYNTPGGGQLIMTISGVDTFCATPTAYTVLLDKVNPPTTPVCQNLSGLSCNPGSAVRSGATYYWRVHAQNCCGSTLGPVWSFSTNVPADFDHDGDVDQTDYAHFQLCLSGLAAQPDPLCQDARLSGDVSIGPADLALFLQCANGSDVTPVPECAD